MVQCCSNKPEDRLPTYHQCSKLRDLKNDLLRPKQQQQIMNNPHRTAPKNHLADATNHRHHRRRHRRHEKNEEQPEPPTKKRAFSQEKPAFLILPEGGTSTTAAGGTDNHHHDHIGAIATDAAGSNKSIADKSDDTSARNNLLTPPLVGQDRPPGELQLEERQQSKSSPALVVATEKEQAPVVKTTRIPAVLVKSTTRSVSGRGSPPSCTPYGEWKDHFQDFMIAHGFLGSLLIRGLEASSIIAIASASDSSSNHEQSNNGSSSSDLHHDSDAPLGRRTTRRSALIEGTLDNSDEEEMRNLLSRQDLDSFRYILITESRAEKLESTRDFLFGEQAAMQQEGETPVFYYDQHGSFGRQVYLAWETWGEIQRNVKSQSDRLDWLIALTHTIHEFDQWMYDHAEAEDNNIEIMVKSIAAYWRRLFLKERNGVTDLGWDFEYTKPGILELLSQFKAKVEACPALGPFNYSIL